MNCTHCGNANDEAAKFCSGCGANLSQEGFIPSELKATVEITNQESLYRAFVGSKNQNYYVERFSQFDQAGGAKATWNWPAFFVTFYWLLYRKMWQNALIYFLLPYIILAIFGVGAIFAGDSAASIIGIGYALVFISFLILPPMYVDALYYRHCQKKIASVLSTIQDRQQQLGEIGNKGGTSNIVVIILVIVLFFMVGIVAAIAIPAYQDFTTRAHVAQASILGRNASQTITTYYEAHQMIPSNLDEAGFVEPLPNGVQGIEYDNANGVVSVTMTSTNLSGKSINFVPSLDENNQLVWTCMSADIQDRYLMSDCRQAK